MSLELNQELLQQLMATFSIELEEQTQAMTDGLLMLEKGVQGDVRRQTLEAVFRAAHNVKGAARGVDLVDISDIAHDLESLFGILKRQNLNPDGAVTDLALEALDGMRQSMAAYQQNQSAAFDKADLLARLQALVTQRGTADQAAAEPQTAASAPAANPTPASIPEPTPTPAASSPTPPPSSASSAPQPSPVAPAVEAEAVKPAAATPAASASAEVVRVNLEKLENLAALAEELQVMKIEMEDHLASVLQVKSHIHEIASGWRRSGAGSGVWPRNQQDQEAFLKQGADAIAELDTTTSRMHRDMRTTTSRLSILVGALQDDVRMMRLVPVATLLRPMTRSVRDISRELGKQVNFEIRGDEIEIDRTVLEGIRDPLVHLLRNALDHGIETPDARRAAGKPGEGSLRISVRGEGGQIVMTIEDDGNGIHVDRIMETARRKKIATDAELAAMGRDEILSLVFRPGFSSKDIVTSISGRGVGLDVVVSNLRSLKGAVQIETEEGKGTRFILKLPITLATDHGVLVRAGGTVFAIPTAAVDRVMELRGEDVLEVEASHAIMHHGRAIPLRDLAGALELESREPLDRGHLPVVVVSKGWDSVAFLVEEVIGEREVVVKPFRPPLMSVRNVTGGTLTGSGEVIMVLNPSDLVDTALHGARARLDAIAEQDETAAVPRILVVDDSITTRTLEKSILEHAGYDVSVAVDGNQAWSLLQEQSFDLVVSDVEMPGMDGFQLAERIKQSPKLKDMPVIIVTSLAKEADRRRGVEAGADAYIVKGQFETKALLDVVAQLV
jgi:two-component system chemotaxis sensor kinase CheA